MAGIQGVTGDGQEYDNVKAVREFVPEFERVIPFNDAAYIPTDISDAADVLAAQRRIDTFPTTARRVQLLWRAGPINTSGVDRYGPLTWGVRVTVNTLDGSGAVASERLKVTDPGAGPVSTDTADTYTLYGAEDEVEIEVDAALTDIYVSGLPSLLAPTVETSSYLTVRILG